MKAGSIIIAALTIAFFAIPTGPVPAQAGKDKDPLAGAVRRAIDDGKRFLYDKQKPDGSWEVDINSEGRRGGWTCLAMLALLNCGEKAEAPVVARGLKWLREQTPSDTYVFGLQAMVFAEAGQAQDLGRIQRNVDWLIKNRVMDGALMIGWGYKADSRTADNSNTQYALLGLWAGKNAGAKINAQVWDEIVQFYMRTQDNSGYWYYIPQYKTSSFTMTTAGVSGLIISGQDVNSSLQKLDDKTGVAAGCGKYVENEPVAKGMAWIVKEFNIEGKGAGRTMQATFYNLYGLERLGRLTGQRFFGEYDWYREGCAYLTKAGMQQDNGSWYLRGSHFDAWPVVSTSFSLLFLSKGRTPVLISKLVHGPQGDPGTDWNRKHNDLRNVADYCSRELFKKQPMGWQIFNARQTQKNADDLLPELLQSPIAWLSGHNRPNFSNGEEELLVKYVEQGGFLFAEACCGSPDFDKGFRAMMVRMFKDTPLKKLPPEHPIYKAHAVVSPADFELWGIEHGCKTVVVYSPKPIAGYWEANQSENGRGREAFRLAGNVVAYATGMEPPKAKGVVIEVSKDKPEAKVPRGFVKVAQLRLDTDWRPAPQAIRNLMAHLKDKAGLDASLVTQEIFPDDVDLLNFKFMYLHGRSEFTIKTLKVLKANLETGGLLFADACCGKDAFDKSFRELVKQLYPDKKLEPIPAADDLYSKDLNGQAISSVRCRREVAAEYQNMAPALEGIKVNGRWVVIYSKYDIGCALEKHQSTDCRGHDHDSALRLAAAALLYALQR